MQKVLLIAEKPSLMRTIEGVYNKHKSEIPMDIHFVSQAGHLYRLLLPNELRGDEPSHKGENRGWSWDDIPFDPDTIGGFKYAPITSSRDLLSKIKNELKSGNYDAVINAGDPDQEGELLIRETLSELKNRLPVYRFWTNDLTEPKVLEALKNLKDDNKDPMCVHLLEAALARQHSDYRVGMNISEAASLKMHGRVAVGRVKATVLAMVCKREIEIKNFKPTTVYGVKINYAEGFSGRLYNPADVKTEAGNGKEGKDDEEDTGVVYFKTKAEADKFIKEHTGPTTVTVFEGKNAEKNAPKLLKLATAQIAAGKHGYDSAKTLEIIQSLYEQKVLSYPRTDCEYISSNEDYGAMLESAKADPALAGFIEKIPESAIKAFKTKKAYVNDKALTESGHSALTPTDVAPDWSSLTKAQKDIYDIIARQYVAAFFPPLIQKKTTMLAELSDGSCFKSTGTTLVDRGYTEVFGTKTSDTNIPEHKKGDSLGVRNFENAEKTSRCPKRFKDPDLIAACENPKDWLNDESLKKLGKALSIGTPATRAGIITQLIEKDKYIAKGKDGYLSPTDIGMKIYENLKDFKICQVDLTGEWEEKLNAIRKGELSRSEMEEGMKAFVAEMVNEIKNADMGSVSANAKKAIGKCPVCGGDILEGNKGFYCSNWNNSEYAKAPGDKGCKFGIFKKVTGDSGLTAADASKLLRGAVIKKKLKKGTNTWEQELSLDMATGKIIFVGSENRPKAEAIGTCPKCGKRLMEGSKGFYCEDFKGCGFGGFKDLGSRLVTAEEYSALAAGVSVKGLTMDPETGAVGLTNNFKCPVCGKPLTRSGKTIYCSCGFKLWTNICQHELTDDDIDKLLKGESVGPYVMMSKKGKTFNACITLNGDKTGTELEFV